MSDIKRRIVSVKQTRQITGAMETISVVKMRKSLERFDKNHDYFDILYAVMANIVKHADPDAAELIAPPESGRKAVIVIASDKGLCGSFNHDIFRTADEIIDGDTVVMPIGQTAVERYGARDNADNRFGAFGGQTDYAHAKAIADAVIEMYGHGVRSVAAVYTHTASHSSWAPRVMKILPVDIGELDGKAQNADVSAAMMFEPSASAVLEKLTPMYVGGLIYGAFIHSDAAEHSARRVAMSAAAKNADEMIGALSVEYNRARQAAVTEQITEIIGSTQAPGR